MITDHPEWIMNNDEWESYRGLKIIPPWHANLSPLPITRRLAWWEVSMSWGYLQPSVTFSFIIVHDSIRIISFCLISDTMVYNCIVYKQRSTARLNKIIFWVLLGYDSWTQMYFYLFNTFFGYYMIPRVLFHSFDVIGGSFQLVVSCSWYYVLFCGGLTDFMSILICQECVS
jgi:hypothetical protein